MELIKTEFTEFENKKKYKLTTFKEEGITINVLSEDSSASKTPSGNYYAFGLIEDGVYYWLWYGQTVYYRSEMRKYYAALLVHLNQVGSKAVPFVCKVKR